MMFTLFCKECRLIGKSFVYYLFVIVFVLYMASQLGDDSVNESIGKPQPGQAYYGVINSSDETVIMECAITSLMKETYANSFSTYPLMFYKQVILNEKELEDIKEILERASGKSYEALMEKYEAEYTNNIAVSYEEFMAAEVNCRINVHKDYRYEEFAKDMETVCDIVGNGSDYEKEKYENRAMEAMTYEQACEEYDAFCEKDKVTGGFARLFCDYAGIMLALLPIFIGVTRCLGDKRAKAAEVIYAGSCASWKLILARYAANVVMVFLPVLAVACVYQFPVFYRAETIGVTPDYLAFVWYSLIWLLPEIMIVLAVSFFITEWTEGVLAVLVQGVWAIISLSSVEVLVGNFGLQLIARWNCLGETTNFLAQREAFFFNRGFYAILAVVFVGLTIVVYEQKRRKGETIYGKVFKSRR